MSSDDSQKTTSQESSDPEKPAIVIDEDWKTRVKAEDAALDQKRQDKKKNASQSDEQGAAQTEEGGGDSSDTTGEEFEMPPASFSSLVEMFTTQAMVGLGVVPNPVSGKADPQLKLARHFIDLLSIIEKKTEGNLEADEKSMLNSTLHQLRTMFLQQSKAPTQQEASDDS